MYKNKEIQNAISIKDILENDIYTIPIYQRNYEWETQQIAKLIQDIDSINIMESEGVFEKYYLGTLVTFKTIDGKYELIDGQQRHTTLNLIKAVLNKKNENFNLEFQARSECDFFLKQLSLNGTGKLNENPKTQNLQDGIKIIKEVFNENKKINPNFITDFRIKFLEQTFIFRTELPEETELNHYFEIMNNRGEQLEKHEILKAQLMGVFGQDDKKSETFSKIWDACSYMGDYVWNNFDKDISLKIFSNDFKDFSFENLSIDISVSQTSEINGDLFSIISNHNIPANFSQEDQEKTDKFHSVLDFPTFLLYAFYFIKKDENSFEVDKHSFDDKKLLDVFKDYKDSEIFITKLLQLRIYFDKYVIKNDLSNQSDSKWGIRTVKIENSEIKTTESVFDDSLLEDNIEMLQSMFYYTSLSENKKDWLLELLDKKPEWEEEINRILFEKFKASISNVKIDELKYPEVSIKTFYYFEYMLWEFYKNFVQGEINLEINQDLVRLSTKIGNVKVLFNTFRFRQLNSKEHLLSQNKFKTFQKELNLEDNDLNSFSNLCLISTSENASASNDNHYEKKSRFSNSNISLKRIMMFESFKDQEWEKECMIAHQKDMQELLDYYRI